MNSSIKSIASNLVTLSLGALIAACSGAEMDEGEQFSGANASDELESDSFERIESEITSCDDHQYDHWRYLSALAVASANELGRWSVFDFALSGNSVQLSSIGQSRCAYDCPNVKAILQMQSDVTRAVPRHDPQLLRNLLWSYFERQVNWNKSNPVPSHSLTLSRVTDDICGLRYHFKVGSATQSSTGAWTGSTELKATHSNRCVDIAYGSMNDGGRAQQYDCWGGANQKFAIQSQGNNAYRIQNVLSGKCLGSMGASPAEGTALEQRGCGANDAQLFQLNSKGGDRFELKHVKSGRCVDVRNISHDNAATIQIWSCNGGSWQTFAAAGITVTANPPVKPSSLATQLKLFGEAENRYLMFQSTATEVSIDPMGTMVDGGSSASSGACYEGSTVFSHTNVKNACCIVSGKYGKLTQSAWNTRMYYCQ